MADNSNKKDEGLGVDDFALLEEILEMLSAEQIRRRDRTEKISMEASQDQIEHLKPVQKIEPKGKGIGEQRPAEPNPVSGITPDAKLITPVNQSAKPATVKNSQEDFVKESRSVDVITEPGRQDSKVILESSYETSVEYSETVFGHMNRILKNHGYQTSPRILREGVRATVFSTRMQGMTIECRVLCENTLFTYRIEFAVSKGLRPERLPLIEYLMQGINSGMKYGAFVADKKEGEIKLVYSSCYRGAFVPNVFDRYVGALLMTCREYCKPLAEIAGDMKLSEQAICDLRQIIGQSAVCLPMKFDSNWKGKLYQQMVRLFGSSAPDQSYKLIASAIDQIPDGLGYEE